MSAADPREWVGQLNRVRQRTFQLAAHTRKLARMVIESPQWRGLPADAQREWTRLEDDADRLTEALMRRTT